MSVPAAPASLRELVARLPFALDEAGQVGAAFERWREAEGAEADEHRRVVELWTYCFVRRYFTVKFAVNSHFPASDLDEQVGRVYRKVEEKRVGIDAPERYAQWVSVVCKNTFFNYVNRKRPPDVSLDEEEAPSLATDRRTSEDLGLAHKVALRAVGRLPDYLQPVARMRFLEGRSYEAIARQIDASAATARSYASRARRRLRADPAMQALLKDS